MDGGYRDPGLRKQWHRLWKKVYPGNKLSRLGRAAIEHMTDAEVIADMARLARKLPTRDVSQSSSEEK